MADVGNLLSFRESGVLINLFWLPVVCGRSRRFNFFNKGGSGSVRNVEAVRGRDGALGDWYIELRS